jgi:hypothetical protein
MLPGPEIGIRGTPYLTRPIGEIKANRLLRQVLPERMIFQEALGDHEPFLFLFKDGARLSGFLRLVKKFFCAINPPFSRTRRVGYKDG